MYCNLQKGISKSSSTVQLIYCSMYSRTTGVNKRQYSKHNTVFINKRKIKIICKNCGLLFCIIFCILFCILYYITFCILFAYYCILQTIFINILHTILYTICLISCLLFCIPIWQPSSFRLPTPASISALYTHMHCSLIDCNTHANHVPTQFPNSQCYGQTPEVGLTVNIN